MGPAGPVGPIGPAGPTGPIDFQSASVIMALLFALPPWEYLPIRPAVPVSPLTRQSQISF